jgi:hypothetical protein
MPAKSKLQQMMMGIALEQKRGKMPFKGQAARAAKQMSEKRLKDFASTKRKGLPMRKNPIKAAKGLKAAMAAAY